jgi:hypothetical protein
MLRTRLLRITAACALLSANACGDPKDGTSSVTDVSTTADTGSTEVPTSSGDTTPGDPCAETQVATDACCCFDRLIEDGGATVTLKNSCPFGAEECGAIDVTCVDSFDNDGDCADDQYVVADSEAADLACVFDALRAAQPARVGWRVVAVPGFAGHDTTVYVTSMQDVIRTSRGYVDLDTDIGEIGRFALPPAAFFDDCEAMATPLAQFECLRSFVDGAPASTCMP